MTYSCSIVVPKLYQISICSKVLLLKNYTHTMSMALICIPTQPIRSKTLELWNKNTNFGTRAAKRWRCSAAVRLVTSTVILSLRKRERASRADEMKAVHLGISTK